MKKELLPVNEENFCIIANQSQKFGLFINLELGLSIDGLENLGYNSSDITKMVNLAYYYNEQN